MFNLENYYQKAFSGEVIDTTEIINYIKSFRHVILWGASFQGKAIGRKLTGEGVIIENYWDIRADEIKEVDNIQVIKPFMTKEKDNTLVIVCIGNRVIVDKIIGNLIQRGYSNVIPGDYLYMGILCPFNKNSDIDAKRCSVTMECRQVYCHRLGNIIKSKKENIENPLHLTSVTLIINQRCSLGCKHCTSYMNEYAKGKRLDIPYERIAKDIDVFFDAVDTVGTITVMGGEPFMHPDISKIIQKLCKKNNFGLISIATSGTYPIKEKQLEGLCDRRVNISISNYTESISENQKKVYYENLEMIKKSNVCYTEGLFSPEWIVPSTLYDLNLSEEEKIERKKNCTHWHQIKNGKVHPCDLANSLYSLGIADYNNDYVDLTDDIGNTEMKEKIREYINRSYYYTCGYHDSNSEMTAKAAEQGYMDFKRPIQ